MAMFQIPILPYMMWGKKKRSKFLVFIVRNLLLLMGCCILLLVLQSPSLKILGFVEIVIILQN